MSSPVSTDGSRYLSVAKDGKLYIKVRVQPRASRTMVAGVTEVNGDARLKISLTSPPVDGEANAALTSFLAKLFKVKKSSVEVASGLKSRSKGVKLDGVTMEEAERIIEKVL